MSTKVLVFESDPSFAGELRNELGNLGCSTTVVDDGNLGLQQAAADKPDLILLSIELPRMNGFSVCNKLKKDPGLKDIPLIIMSSESSDETFEQHKKLRTRAEDYVHKPVAFGELLQHIQSFVPLGPPPGEPEGVIVIDDEIEVGSTDYLVEEVEEDNGSEAGLVTTAVIGEPRKGETVDADVDALAESAFGRITAPDQHATADTRPARNGSMGPLEPSRAQPRISAAGAPPPPRASVAPPPARGVSVRPPPAASGVDPVEHERLRDDLARARERLTAGERDLDEARREIEKLHIEAGEAERFAREVDELKAKLAAGAKTGGISSRDFLDLREALNKKDKEILSLKEQLSKKDKEIVESQDRGLALERGKADLDERLLGLEREVTETKEKNEALSTDKDLAKKASEDLRARLEKAKGEGETKDRQLSDLRAKQAEERAASDAKLAAARAELDQELANERAAQARSLDEAEARRTTDVEQAERDRDTALSEAREQADQAKRDALSAQSAQIKQEHEAVLTVMRRAHQEDGDRARTEAAEYSREAEEQHEKALAALRKEGDDRLTQERLEAQGREQAALAAVRSEHMDKAKALENDRDARIASVEGDRDSRIATLEGERDARIAALENDRDSRVAALEAKAARELGESNDKLAKLEMDVAAVRGELQSLREGKDAADAASATRIVDLETRLADALQARDELVEKHSASTARIGVLEGDLANVRRDLTGAQENLTKESSRAEKAFAKRDADKQSLERAKDALAVALAQIEEAEGRV